MGSNDLQRLLPAPADFADTVQSEPPAPVADRPVGESLPAPDSDIGLDLGGEAEPSVAERPTLSHIGRYALKTLLGEGGLGRVYEAWDPLLSRTVAVKTLQFDLDMPSRIALDRLLLNEARAAANLSHAHIVTVYDAGLSAHGVYIAMERLRGRDLRQMLDEGWRPTPEAAAQIVRRVADALAYAHARGVVHCDIKPGNIFLARREKPKVLDFGIARAAHASSLQNADALIAGSPHYLAPEQLDGGAVDARTDIYALGVVLYELLAGKKAFRGDNLEQILGAVRHGQATPLHELRPELPHALADIVAGAMDVDPARRPASAAELSRALRQWAATSPAVAATPATSADAGTAPGAARARWPGWVAGGAATAAAALAAWFALPVTGNETPARQQTLVTPAAAPVAPEAPPNRTADFGPASRAPAAVEVEPPRPSIEPKPVLAKPAPRPAPARTRTALVAPEATPAVVAAMGTLQIAVSPWGEVEVDGRSAGTTPPLTRLTLPEGTHTITIRNTDFVPYTATVQVQGDKPALVRHRFGS